ncbi:GWxTD domain-containing protein [Roseisolibacter sp. H3M3-2]|uniref:GWxTD domain-containing protein n=1 Tax=Roseisolibacter sp. H3M3-2 TaxID=3031323 RepID=UPI0023DAB52E|nr:GWxTD domain-containing protein [Roseisolibacter sp. H3M3-2]MDF1505609.1 GWxTD domain-containing protein [Roseisolibacter sp. H3M3-2]
MSSAAPRALRALPLAALALAPCAPRPRVGDPAGGPRPDARRGAPPAPLTEMTGIYQQMGLIVPRGDVPAVGTVAYFARSGDSTLAVVTLSLANRALAFVREGDRYRAAYQVRMDLRPDASVAGARVVSLASDEVVRVATFRETARTDESVLFTQGVVLAPGRYTLALAVRDVGASRSSVVDVPLTVPRLGAGALSTPVLAYEVTPRARLDTLPRLVASPRAAAVFGVDSLVPVYVEAYGAGGADAPPRLTVQAAVRVPGGGAALSRGAVALDRRVAAVQAAAQAPLALYSGVVRVPVSRAGIGVVAFDAVVRAPGGPAADADSVRAPLFVSLGEELPVASFEQMVDYLRYYATPERLRVLRDTTPEARAGAWAVFLRETDPAPTTAQHEGLREYFTRLRAANLRFREEATSGWLTDRGTAYLAFGEPDQILDPNGPEQNVRGRTQVWEYRDPRVTLVFVDQSGFGRWRLNTQSASVVQAALRQRLVK